MKKGPESILDSKTDGLREDYQSIPELTIHDIASLEDLALDQDRREKFYSSSVRRRSWLALFTLFLVGGVTLWSSIADQTAESVSLVEEKGLAVLSTETDVDEESNMSLESFEESNMSLESFEESNTSLESFETQDSQCGGPIEFKALTTFCPDGSCGLVSSSANERRECSETTGIIRGAIGGGLALLLDVIGGNRTSVPGYIGTLVDLLFNTIWSLICNANGKPSPAYVEYADVVAISKRVFKDQMRNLISRQLVHETRNLDEAKKKPGFKWGELDGYARKFHSISDTLSDLGFEGNAIFFTAGEMNLLLLERLKTYAENEMNQPCIDWMKVRIKRSAEDFLNGWQRIFEDYTNYVGNLTAPENVEFSKSGPQGCWDPIRGFTYYIWTAYVNVPNTNVKFINVTSDRSKGGCPTDNSQKDNARNKLAPMIEKKIRSEYNRIISADVITFFDNLCEQVNREGDWRVEPYVCGFINRFRWRVGLDQKTSIGPRPRPSLA